MSPDDKLDPVDRSTETADSDEVIVMLTLQFKPGSADRVLAEMVPGVHLTRAEPGNNEFQFFKVSNSDDTYVVFERWKSQADLEWHWNQPYTKRALQLFDEELLVPLSEDKDVAALTDLMKGDG